MIHTPLSDAERQRRRRHNLKAKTEEEKYSPAIFIANAVCKLASSGDISTELLEKIRVTAAGNVKLTYPNLSVIMQKYAAKRITDFLTLTKTETEDESL